jgi:hypothetical protein
LTTRGIATALALSAAATTEAGAESETKRGNTKATAVASGFSELWQQDIEQFILSPMVCSQSMCESCATGATWR